VESGGTSGTFQGGERRVYGDAGVRREKAGCLADFFWVHIAIVSWKHK